MNIYLQRENENSLRNYPLSEDAELVGTNSVPFPCDVFVDAILYPIVGTVGEILLDSVDFSSGGEVRTHCGQTVMAGRAEKDDASMELYDAHGRHAGSLVLGQGWSREFEAARKWEFSSIAFCAFVSCPVVYAGVEAIVAPNGDEAINRSIRVEGDDCISPVLEENDGRFELSFDAVFDPGMSGDEGAVRQIVFAAVGRTLFSISSDGGADVLLSTPEIDRDDVCQQAHREDSVSTVSDTCERPPSPCPDPHIPTKHDEMPICPSDSGAINLVAYDVLGLRNAVKVDAVQGETVVPTPMSLEGATVDEVLEEGFAATARPASFGGGIEISIPGIGNV